MKNTKAERGPRGARRASWGAAIAIAAIAGICSSNSALAGLAQPFTQGNIVVDRIGNGSAALAAPGTPIFLDQYTPTGTLVSSQPIPTNGANTFVDTGNSTTEGFPTLNPFGTNLVLAGYNVTAGTATASATAAAAPRAVATVDFNGSYSLIATSSTAFSSGNIRTATTDGANNYWAAGSVTGVDYMGTGPSNVVSVPVNSVNNRFIHEVGGNLYISTGSTTHGIYEISGTPTAGTNGNNTPALLMNCTALSTASSPYDFEFNPGMTTCYVADMNPFTNSATVGGIEKWTFNGSAWVYQYTLAPGGVFELAVDWTTTPATIYAVATSVFVKVQDTGIGAVPVTNATAAANTAFRGLALAPTNATVVAAAPAITGISPSTLTANVGSTATFTLSGFTGNPVGSNFWYKVTAGPTTNLLGSQTGQSLVLSNVQLSDTANYFAVISNATGSATSAVVSLTVTASPTISAIAPPSVTTFTGGSATFTLTSTPGTPAGSNHWFKFSAGITNVLADGTQGSGSTISGSLANAITISNVQAADAVSYFATITNASGSATSSVVTVSINDSPSITSLTPASVTTNAGQTVVFTLTTGSVAATSYWYQVVSGPTTNFVTSAPKAAGATSATLTLPGVVGSSAGNYFAVLTNASGSATSTLASLTVTNDPSIQYQPSSALGLVDGTVQFTVTAFASSPTYQWYYSDLNSNLMGTVNNGMTTASGVAVVSGAGSSTLTIANVQATDPTNFVVVVTDGSFGSVTSSVASLITVANTNFLAFWDFNSSAFTNTALNPNCIHNPATFLGVGTALPVGSCDTPGTSPFSGSIQGTLDGPGEPFPAGQQLDINNQGNFAWGTSAYPANGSNTLNGVQFNVSTVGAKNIKATYTCRVSATASDFERLQYTTNGTTWVDYPASSTMAGIFNTFDVFDYDLSGFPGVANNPNFGIRVVTEIQSTASYGVSANTNYLGTANTYGTGGTVTYDLVGISGDAITNPASFSPPVVSSFADTNMPDYTNLTIPFTVMGETTPPHFTYTASALNVVGSANLNPVNPLITFAGTNGNRVLNISFPGTPIPDPIDASPILITVSDPTNGSSTAQSFLLTVSSINLPPTNTLVSLGATNTLPNTPISMTFFVNDDRTALSSLTYTGLSTNNTLVPAANITFANTTTTTPTVTITPASNQLGVASLGIAVSDNDPTEPRTTTANIAFMVRPNTNVVGIDYFNYDSSGSLDSVSSGFWKHLTGVNGQLQVNSGSAVVDAINNTENLQTSLLNGPFLTNSGATLYASYTVKIDDTGKLPTANGSYVTTFNDGSGTTGLYECLLIVATNGAAPGAYRLGIANCTNAAAANTALNATMFPQDLAVGVTNVVVTALKLTNSVSTLWVNPGASNSLSVTDGTIARPLKIADFELRESGSPNGGTVRVGHLTIGTTFDSVFPALNIQQVGSNVVVNWSNPVLGIQSASTVTGPYVDVVGATPPYTNNPATNGAVYFRFGQ